MAYATNVTLLDLEGGATIPPASARLWMLWTEVGGPQAVDRQDEYDRQDLSQTGTTFPVAFPVRGPSVVEMPNRSIGISLQDLGRVAQDEGFWFRSGRFDTLPAAPIEVVLAPPTDVPATDLTSGLTFPIVSGSETITGVTLTPGTPAGQIGFTATGTTTRVPGTTLSFTYSSTLSVAPSAAMTDPTSQIVEVGIAPGTLTFVAGPGQGFVTAILNGVAGLLEARARPQLRATLNSRVNAAAFDAVAGRLLPPPRLNPDGSPAATPVWPASIVPSVRTVRVTSTGIQIRAALGAFGGVVQPLRAEWDRIYPPDPSQQTGSRCPASMLAVDGLLHPIHLQALRAWRDGVLGASPAGRVAAARFRGHAGEVSRILASDPSLALAAARVARRAAASAGTGLDGCTVEQGERVLRRLMRRGSASLASDIAWAIEVRPWEPAAAG